MKNKLTDNSKKLIYTECFKFTFLGRYKIEILPKGKDYYQIICKGFKPLYDNLHKCFFIQGYNPKFKDILYTDSLYNAINIWSNLIKDVISTYQDEDYNLDLKEMLTNYNEFLPEIKEFL